MKKKSKRYFVYIVRCADSTLYTGSAVDVMSRIQKHNAGTGARYTRARLPVALVHREKLPTWSAALKREAQIKRMTKQQKELLVKTSA